MAPKIDKYVIKKSTFIVLHLRYESKGIGCYMFKINEDTVIGKLILIKNGRLIIILHLKNRKSKFIFLRKLLDATMKGNAARFINHSCDPNCYSRIVDILGKKHIIIFAMRKIVRGEELTYDYKFPIEDVKLPCNCGARKCRKYMN